MGVVVLIDSQEIDRARGNIFWPAPIDFAAKSR